MRHPIPIHKQVGEKAVIDIRRAARELIPSVGGYSHNVQPHFEHGQWWAVCLCGAVWSVNDCNNEYGLCFEEISEGDGEGCYAV